MWATTTPEHGRQYVRQVLFHDRGDFSGIIPEKSPRSWSVGVDGHQPPQSHIAVHSWGAAAIEGFRPGVAERLRRNPRLIFARMTVPLGALGEHVAQGHRVI